MPLYEYRCDDCAAEFETLVRSGEQVTCEKCGSHHLEKLLSAAAGRVSAGSSLPIRSACPPSDAPPCSPGCCRLP